MLTLRWSNQAEFQNSGEGGQVLLHRGYCKADSIEIFVGRLLAGYFGRIPSYGSFKDLLPLTSVTVTSSLSPQALSSTVVFGAICSVVSE